MSRRKILVVDDDRDMLRLMGKKLGAKGYEVVWASDGVTAISSARKEQPDLIVLDLGLPAGDGFVCLERLSMNVELSRIPVIVLTGRAGKAVEARALDCGAAAFIEKSQGPEALISEIGRQFPIPALS